MQGEPGVSVTGCARHFRIWGRTELLGGAQQDRQRRIGGECAANGLISCVYSKFSYGIDQFSLRSYPQRKKCAWSPGVRGIGVSKLPQVRDADAIILYWVAGGYLTPKII